MFWKENKSTVFRLWVNHFGAIVFGIMLSVLAIMLTRKTGGEHEVAIYVAIGVVGTVFFWYLIYLMIWEVGAKDRIRVDGGRLEPRPNHGLKLGLAAAIPGIVFCLVYFVVTYLYGCAGVQSEALVKIGAVAGPVSFILNAPYVGFFLALFGRGSDTLPLLSMYFPYAAVVAFSVIPAIIVTWVSYLLGYNGKLMSRLYKPDKKE